VPCTELIWCRCSRWHARTWTLLPSLDVPLLVQACTQVVALCAMKELHTEMFVSLLNTFMYHLVHLFLSVHMAVIFLSFRSVRPIDLFYSCVRFGFVTSLPLLIMETIVASWKVAMNITSFISIHFRTVAPRLCTAACSLCLPVLSLQVHFYCSLSLYQWQSFLAVQSGDRDLVKCSKCPSTECVWGWTVLH
jgi:hypothetical protein